MHKLPWTECNRSEILRYFLSPAGTIEVAGFAYCHIVNWRRPYRVVPSLRRCVRRDTTLARWKRHSMATSLDEALPIFHLSASLQALLQVRNCQITRPCLIGWLLLPVRNKVGGKIGSQNNVLIACFTADEVWDCIVHWLEPLLTVATLDTLSAGARFNAQSLLGKRP